MTYSVEHDQNSLYHLGPQSLICQFHHFALNFYGITLMWLNIEIPKCHSFSIWDKWKIKGFSVPRLRHFKVVGNALKLVVVVVL